MTKDLIDKRLYDAIVNFDRDAKAQDYFYEVMESKSGRMLEGGREETVREQILRVYGILFCEDTGLEEGRIADVDDVAYTADRLYIDSVGFDADHWYRMKYHFPVIDEDNYDRFAALVISDLHSGPLHDAAKSDGKTLLIGEPDPLLMTVDERKNQIVHAVSYPGGMV